MGASAVVGAALLADIFPARSRDLALALLNATL